MTLDDAYRFCFAELSDRNIDEADFKSLCLVCGIAGINNSDYPVSKKKIIDKNKLNSALNRLIDGEPLQYVLGKWDFYESEFYVGEGVLIPRPETEELVEKAIEVIRSISQPVVYDLCSGSGCIGISIAKKRNDAMVYCVEKSTDAFTYLCKNAVGLSNISCINDDINNDIELPSADLIVSNPPYIKSDLLPFLQEEVKKEPAMALDGGSDGLDFYRLINDKWHNKLKKDAYLLLEIGNEQGKDIKQVLNHFKDIKVIKDIYNNDRIVMAKRLDKFSK